MAILVTGGAGYIGSHVALSLLERGEEVIILDNFCRGNRHTTDVLKKLGATVVIGDAGDSDNCLPGIFHTYDIETVVHLAAFAYVGESVQNPLLYYERNVGVTMRLLHSMLTHGVKNFVFSSTCATYGIPPSVPVTEDMPQLPINPYGESKLTIEKLIKALHTSHKLNYAIFRYFNAAGADPEGRIGEMHDPEPHVIPNILSAAHTGGQFNVLGDDYPTRDGSAIRDYIHVRDIGHAHALGVSAVTQGKSGIYNLANGSGYSVSELIRAAEQITGKSINVEFKDARPGDPPSLVGCANRAKTVLGWEPQYPDLETILNHAWTWEQKRAKIS